MSFPKERGYYWMRRMSGPHMTDWRVVKVFHYCADQKCSPRAKDFEGLVYLETDTDLEFGPRIMPPPQ